jgi:signal transduction histidine kinase
VQIHIGLEASLFIIEVIDNGKGFDPSAKLRGNGLANMKRRMEKIGGRCLQTSEPAAGTRVRLELVLADTPHPVNHDFSKS